MVFCWVEQASKETSDGPLISRLSWRATAVLASTSSISTSGISFMKRLIIWLGVVVACPLEGHDESD